MPLRRSIVLLLSALTVLAVAPGCSSKSSKKKSGASGAAAKTTKNPPNTAKPSQKGGSNVTGSVDQSVPVDGVTCDPSEEGLAVCVDTFALFCAGGAAHAIDCAEAFPGSTCGELDDGTVDCVIESE